MDDLEKKIIDKINSSKKVPDGFTISIQNALYKDKEENKSKNNLINFAKIFVTTCAGIIIVGGVSFAGYEIYQKIWNKPEKINLEQAGQKSIEEFKSMNITEEEAKEIANQKLKELGFENDKIIETDNYLDSINNSIMYRFRTNNSWLIEIDGITGEFRDISLGRYDKDWENYIMARDEAINTAKQFYKQFGYLEGEYELVSLRANDKTGKGNGSGYQFFATFSKEYDELINSYESIYISFYAKDKQLSDYCVVQNVFDNNPVKISKEEAIEIAKTEDRKRENKEIVNTKVELKIEKMNGEAYARENDTENYYKSKMNPDFPESERYYYKTSGKVRRVWVVVFNYQDTTTNSENKTEDERLAERVMKGQYTYFVDCTTGEVIGGDSSDYLRWDNYWSEYYSVK